MNPTTVPIPSFREDHISQIPALQLLVNLGWQYLTPDEALALRGGRRSAVLLHGILERQLPRLNKVRYRGREYSFTEGNIQAAVMALEEMHIEGLVRTNEKIYDLLCLGKSLQQTILGDTKSFPLHYIDWANPANNVFHVTAEFAVERTGSNEARIPDIVLFVNGIPLSVIECKTPTCGGNRPPVVQALEQLIGYQREGEIPRLFIYSQLLLALAKNEARYATTGTPAAFWAVWKEQGLDEAGLRRTVNTPLPAGEKAKLFIDRFAYARDHFDALEGNGGREVTEQDRTVFALCRPERLLELTYRFILFDKAEKKVARYQQYFCVNKSLDRIRRRDDRGRRLGGVVWHTQGSGKSLTMVMLAKAIALEPDITDYKILLVTDRIDLDDQIYRTFLHCGIEPVQAKTGSHLIELIEGHKSRVVTTIIDKFDAALGKKDVRNDSPDIFVLVDESHRGQYGPLHAKMRKVLPRACFLGFTGTPLMRQDKNTADKFGGIIDTYAITQAVRDGAVVPLLYEGRHVEQKVDREGIDAWFDRITKSLSREQVADLKKKFTTTDQLNKARQKVMAIAWDISEHVRDTWQGTPYKAQLVAPNKATALLYKEFLDEFGLVSSEVLISGPGEREGYGDIYSENEDRVQAFWKAMMDKHGSEKEYNRNVINAFLYGDKPEIIIVVDKLLTGFDAPRNTVLYLTRMLKEHTLLQAIARVNRLYEGKDFGYIIDYRGVLSKLDEALDLYGNLPDYEPGDLDQTLTDIAEEVRKLPQRHSDLWDLFRGLKNTRDAEQYERLLADEALRTRFYERLSEYARSLSVALSSVKFIEETPAEKLDRYRGDLKFFMALRTAVRRRYAEVVDFREYEGRIQKLLDTHVGTGEVEQVTGMVNIFDAEAFAREVEKLDNSASKADTIAHRTKKTISERWDEDPAFYRKFSEMLEEAIRAFREQRLSDAAYLRKVTDICKAVRDRTHDGVPAQLRHHDAARAFYGVLMEKLAGHSTDGPDSLPEVAVEAALKIDEIIRTRRIVNWETNTDVQNQMRNDIDELFYDLAERTGVELPFTEVDDLTDQCLATARRWYRS
jgi:type I restriction enzyme R subunit